MDTEYDLPNDETRKWAMLCHLGGVASVPLTPLAGVVIPVIVWLAKRDDAPYIEQQGREAVNFQISMFVYLVLVGTVVWILKLIVIGKILWFLPTIVVIAQVGGSIIGAIRAHDGEDFRYPFILRFI